MSLDALLEMHGLVSRWPQIPPQVRPNEPSPRSLVLLLEKLAELWT